MFDTVPHEIHFYLLEMLNRRRHLLLLTTRLMSIHSYPVHMEKVIPCSDGLHLAALHWSHQPATATLLSDENPIQHHRILCLHGWLDNASSFHLLAPSLIQKLSSVQPHAQLDIVAIDHVGHGKSHHKSPDSTMIFTEFAYYIAETMKVLQWDRTESSQTNTTTTLIGHSMGAAIALLYAAAFPEQIDRLILLDGAGPSSRSSAHVTKHVRDSIIKRLTSNPTLFPHLYPPSSSQGSVGNNGSTRQRVYPSLDSAIEARMSTNYAFQENLYMSREAAAALVHRGTKRFYSDKNKGDDDELESSSAVVFSHDQRLKWPSIQYFSKEQTDAIYHNIHCPTCLLIAKDGIFVPNDGVEITNAQQNIKNISIEKASGSHHFHADPDTAEEVANHVMDFILHPAVIGKKMDKLSTQG